jgi:translation initiation factor 5
MNSDEVNIPRTVQDPNYRYKMPRIQVTVQGTGGGVKTKFDNIVEVAERLKVPTEYPLKFLGRELGSQSEVKDNNYLISGNHQAEKLQSILDKYYFSFILG